MRPRIILAFIIGLAVSWYAFRYYQFRQLPTVSDFASCINAPGSSIQDSYPVTCVARTGDHFTQPWIIYSNTKYGYSFQYPSQEVIVTENNGASGFQDANPESTFITLHSINGVDLVQDFSIEPKIAKINGNLLLYVREKYYIEDGFLRPPDIPYSRAIDEKILELENLSINGRPAVKLVTQVIPDQGSTLDIFFRVFIEYEPDQLLLIQDSLGLYHDIAFDNYILSTFHFSDSSSSESYTCPSNGWASCMPILSEEGEKACSDDAVNWYEQNCPNFEGIAY
jgi:hypothetical protein